MSEQLLGRLADAASKEQIQNLLRAVKEEQALRSGELRVSGSKDDLLQHVRDGIASKLLSVGRVATLVDRIEENGRQFLFLFDLTQEGVSALGAPAFRQGFDVAPPGRTPAMYADVPDEPQVYFSEQADALVVKQVHAATHWELDEQRSYTEETERATFQVLRRHRALNMLRVVPETRQAEIRIGRFRANMKDETVGEHLTAFLQTLSPVVDVEGQMRPTRIWDGFQQLASTREGTFMATDSANDPTATVKFSTRRAGGVSGDIRDHPDYRLERVDYVRDVLNMYWDTEFWVSRRDQFGESGPRMVHTVLARFRSDGREYGRVDVPVAVSPEVLTGVIECIRRFAREAS